MNLRDYARGKHCTVRLNGCNPGPENETVVLAHAPSASKGTGIKSEDWWGAWACSNCHDVMDGRVNPGLTNKAPIWMRAIHETQACLARDGVLEIKRPR